MIVRAPEPVRDLKFAKRALNEAYKAPHKAHRSIKENQQLKERVKTSYTEQWHPGKPPSYQSLHR
jgi:hypothetical protein